MQVEIFAKIFYLETMHIVDDIEPQIQQSEAGTLFFVSDFAKAGNDVFISRLLSQKLIIIHN